MLNSPTKSSVRVLPNNKVYRQLFDAQVQLSDAYKRVRTNQLTQSLHITPRQQSIPLVRNIRPHEAQKRQWMASLPFSNDPNINPITILFHEERKRRQNEQQKELDELKQEVFNLPDDIENLVNDNTENKKGNVTERVATNRQTKYDELWTELLNKIADINHNLLIELEEITRKCNTYYERGDKEIDDQLQVLIYKQEITALTVNSFENASAQIDELLPTRLLQIQEYCQSIEELELERIHEIRDLFKYYSPRLYRTHHLSEKETAYQLEKQANELNRQILENRRTYADLEARLLAGETVRVHRYQTELINYQNKWRDAMWNIYKQTWISKLSECKSAFDSIIPSKCESIATDILTETHSFILHINTLNSFIPPKSTRENIQKWYREGYDIVNKIVNKRQKLLQQINEIIKDEVDLLKKESGIIREKLLKNEVYNDEQIEVAFKRDIEPLFDERKRFLHEIIIERIEGAYERATNAMYDVIDRLLAFIQPAAEQWDNHQVRLEHVTAELNDMMIECRRPYDIQNEKKSTRLDTTLDDLRGASNEKALTRLLISSYEQLDSLKESYTQFYDMEHSVVNKYSAMIAVEVNRYKTEMLDYFHARQLDAIAPHNIDSFLSSSSSSHQYYTTSLTRTTYELEGYANNELNFRQPSENVNNDVQSAVSSTVKSGSDARSRLKSLSYDQSQIHTFLTEDSSSSSSNILFNEVFQIPSNLVNSLMLNVCRAFLDYYDQWKDETIQRSNAVMYAKHEELNKEMDFQLHLHEPRRVRIETDIHNVRAAELVMHDERIERHIRSVQETLEQIDAEYTRMKTEFTKLQNIYTADIDSLEQAFVNSTTSRRLSALEDRLKQQRNTYMDHIRMTLKNFRKHFDDSMQYLRQTNMKFRKSFKTFSDGGNFSRDEIEVYRKKLEKTDYQMEQADTAMAKEMEKLEKKQLEQANKIMKTFRERFKDHKIDLEFIELTNRCISEVQIKIKSEVAIDNQQAHKLKTLVSIYEIKLDALLNPNLDKQPATLNEVRDLFQQIILLTYERGLYIKCLKNELNIPSSLIPTLKQKGLITEKELVNDLHVTGTNETHTVHRPSSRMSAGFGSNAEESKSVRFASASSPKTASTSRRKTGSNGVEGIDAEEQADLMTITTIQSILHKSLEADPNEISEPGVSAFIEPNTRSFVSESSHSSKSKRNKHDKKRNGSEKGSSTNKSSSSSERARSQHIKTSDDIYAYYCTFGEKKRPGEDFLSKILNILQDSLESLLTNSEIYYKQKGKRPVTRPQALRETFEEFAEIITEQLRTYEQQCRSYHEHAINEFRDILELFERKSSLMVKIELDEVINPAAKQLIEYKQKFQMALNKNLNESNNEKEKIFGNLRPSVGHPTQKNRLQTIDNQEKQRQNNIQNTIDQLRSHTTEEIQTNAQIAINSLATSAEHLLILFDNILTVDDIIRPKLPPVRKSLPELIRRQQAGQPLEDSEPAPLMERKQGHWSGLPLLDTQFPQRREKSTSKKPSPAINQRQKISASIVTQKTTIPQIETIKQRDEAYQKYKDDLKQLLADIETKCSITMTELDRYRSYWDTSIDTVQQLRTSLNA